MLRLSTFLLTLSFSSIAAAQQAPAAPTPCPASQVCSPIPPGPPPTMTPQLEAQERARVEQETRAQYTPDAYRDAAQSAYASRQATYQAKLEAARLPDAPIAPPLFEAGLAMRLGAIDKLKHYTHYGPELSLGYRLDRYYVIDLPVAFLQTHDDIGHWLTLGFRPSLLATYPYHDVLMWARFGPDALVPVAATVPLPKAMIGASFGVGVGWIATRLGNGGYAAFLFGVDGAVRAAVSGPPSSADGVRAGLETFAGVRLAF